MYNSKWKRGQKKTPGGHRLDIWWDTPAPVKYQVREPTLRCRCKHCTPRRAFLREYDSIVWLPNSGKALKRNMIVLKAIMEDLSAPV
jgi:hypothetical protein